MGAIQGVHPQTMSDAVNNALYVTAEQLRVGLYIHLDLHWTDHPFTFSSFKIKNQDQIGTIRRLGLRRIRYEPARSDGKPLPPAPPAAAPAEAPPAPPPPPPREAEAVKEKRERIEQLARIRDEIREVEKKFQHASDTVKGVLRDATNEPAASRRQAEELVHQMVESIISRGSVLMHAINATVGEETYVHSLNVAVLSLMLAKTLGGGVEETRLLGMCAVFHDIGKADIASQILNKTEPLTRSEQAQIEKHCALGAEIAKRLGLSIRATEIILQHHEYVDGSGYPRGLTGEKLSPLSMIVAIVNTYDNLCNPPNVADALTPHEALSHIFAVKRSKFQEVPLKAFIRCLGVYPPGSIVRLSNEMFGLVISINSAKPLKPNVLVFDPDIPRDESVIIDMEKESDLNISRSLRPGQLPREVYQYLSPRKRVTYYFDPKKQDQPT